MALTQISTDGIKNGTITGSDLATNVDLVNNQKLRLGTGNDLQIYHDGTNSFIVNNDGDLLIRNTTGNEIKIQAVSGEQSIQCIGDGAVELYFDGSRKLRTKTAGVEIEGELGMSDNNKIKLGTGEDLQIYHDGSHSRIDEVGTGNLMIQSNNAVFIKKGTSEDIARFNVDGAVELLYDASKKFETQNLGVTVTGGVYPAAADTYQLGGSSLRWNELNIKSVIDVSDNGKIRMGDSDDLQIFHNGSDSIIDETGTGNLKIRNSGANKLTVDGNGIILDGKITTIGSGYGSTVFNEDGADVDFRVEGDTQASLFKVDAGNDRVGIGESTPTVVFHATQFNHAFADSTSSLATVPTKSVARFRGSNNASGSLFIGNESSNARCYLQGCNETGNGSIDLLLNPFGANVGIGTTSPVTKLHINGGTYAAPTGGNDGFTQLVISNQSAGQGAGIGLLGAGNMVTFIHFGDSDDANVGAIVYNNVVDSMQFYVNASERMNIDNSGNVNINNDSAKLRLGSHADLQLFHNGSNSYIQDNGTGGLYIGSNGGNVYIRGQHGEESIIAESHGSVKLYHDNVIKMETTSVGITSLDTLITQGELRPGPDNDHSIGRSNRRYITIFAVNGSINTSDKNEKNTIIDSDLGLDFINKLKPKSYKWNKDDGKTHYGLIAQDLEETLTSLGKTIADFGGIYKEDDSPMGLGYSELIAPLIKAVQELSAEVATLKAS